MKKNRIFFAILAVALVTAVAIVSCKKQDEKAFIMQGDNQSNAFRPELIEDYTSYLRDFKLKMQTSKEDYIMPLAEAEWHLSALANYDFGYANVEFSDIRFDTVYCHVHVINGEVSMSDLNVAYNGLHSAIETFFHSLDVENPHIRFVDVVVSENGNVMAIISTTSLSRWHTWFFADDFEAMGFCYYYFDDNVAYYASQLGCSELQRVLNIIESHPTSISGREFYVVSRTKSFYYGDYIDPYGSPSFMNSRLFATDVHIDPDIRYNMCLYLDSYAGLGYEEAQANESPVKWNVEYGTDHYQSYNLEVCFHTLTVKYGHSAIDTINVVVD